MKLNATQLRTQEPDPEIVKKIKKNPIYIILDNVYDTYNVGSIFRLADAVAAKKIFLCGQTETPPNPRIKKASINTWKWVDWEYCKTALKAIEKLKRRWEVGSVKLENEMGSGKLSSKSHIPLQSPTSHFSPRTSIQVVAIEQHTKSIPLSKFKPQFPLCIVVGNETAGVSSEVLKMADQIVELPMYGVNKSLNVMVSLGIVLYNIIDKCLP